MHPSLSLTRSLYECLSSHLQPRLYSATLPLSAGPSEKAIENGSGEVREGNEHKRIWEVQKKRRGESLFLRNA